MTVSALRIAFCTTCRGRLSHLAQTLPQNLRDMKDYDNAAIVLLDYNDQEGLSDYIQHEHRADLDSGRLVYYRTSDPPRFHMAHAKNMAHRCGIKENADLVVTLDSDNLTGPEFASWIAYKYRTMRDLSFLCPDFASLPPPGHRFNARNPVRLGRGFAGRLVIRQQDFTKIGGYDQVFDTWRGEDIDLIARLDRLGVKKGFIDSVYLNAIAHGSEVRFREYPDAQQFENDDIYGITAKASNTIVNYGDFGRGIVRRNFESTPIEFDHVPTRIFGIGFQRTGTSSLHEALRLLGFDSGHWESAEWARAIWWEMNRWNRSATLERYYAVSDNPIPLLYRRLDTAYPGSKFILTIRPEEQWVQSVERLWNYDTNPRRRVWDIDGFSHKIHSITYGRPTFDPPTFLARYREHNEDVLAYFRGREHDLLVLDLSKGHGWKELCAFLNMPQPDTPFPHRHQLSKQGKELTP